MSNTMEAVAAAREAFLDEVKQIRPELHRYCARLTGSVIEAEDIVQESLARGFYALSLHPETPPLRPWLFKIAHNAALDFLKSHGRKHTESRADLSDIAGYDDTPDPAVVRAALMCFAALPVSQRSAVILKDVLGHSLEETAETMGISVMAVKAVLVRGRAKVREAASAHAVGKAHDRASLEKYATLTPRTGTASERSWGRTAASIWCRSRSVRARPSECTSGAMRRRRSRCASSSSREHWRSQRSTAKPARRATSSSSSGKTVW